MLGERIFPLIQRIYPDPDRAAKITGMLLKNDNEDLLRMIEDPDYLSKEAKAAEDYLSKEAKAAEDPDYLSKEAKAAVNLF